MGGSFLDSAKIELQACLQLLAERARFLAGASRAAIALIEQDRFLYRASNGESAPEIGKAAEVGELRSSIIEGQPAFGREEDLKEPFLLVPIRRNAQTAGFFKLWGKDLGEPQLKSTERLAEMVATALDLLEAAEKCGEIVAETYARLEPPGTSAEPASSASSLTSDEMAIHSCKSCGFPVSDRRSLCLDCEERAPSSTPVAAGGLFDPPPEQSWLRTHLFAIASLLITALAAAAIYWLR
jgi:hypothetical protein